MAVERKEKINVLILEDQENDALLLLRELKKSDFIVNHKRIETPDDMQAALQSEKWDVIVSDYAMPRFDALAALSILIQSGQDIPFIVVSGTIGEETAVEAMKAGANDYLMKDNLLRLGPTVNRELREARSRAERRKAEKAVVKNEKKFRLLFENNPLPMWLIEHYNLTFLEANEAAAILYGYRKKEFLRLPVRDIFVFPEKGPADFERRFREAVKKNRRSEWEHRRRDGTIITVEMYMEVLEIGLGKLILAIAQDITQRKQIENRLIEAKEIALQTSQLKTEFLSNVSHEIRTPLNGVIGMLDVLSATPLTPKQKECVSVAKSSADIQLDVIEKVLHFSTLETGRLNLRKAAFKPRALVDDVAAKIAARAEEKKIELKTVVAPDVPDELDGDAERLKEALKSLLENALKFTEKGEIRLSVSKEKEEKNTVFIRFEVRDTGVGVPDHRKSRLFTPFQQADGSFTRQYQGTGLGLAIAKQIVDLMGGFIGCESENGKGSTFWFVLPFCN